MKHGVMPSYLVKVFVEQFDNNLYHAYCNSDKRLSGLGKSIPEAIGRAIETHVEELGIVLEVQAWNGVKR